MTDTAIKDASEISLFALATALLKNRWKILGWAFAGALLAALSVISKPQVYYAGASFVPEGTDNSRSGLSSIASQFGVSVPSQNQSLSPDFYARLLTSRVVLIQIAYDTVTVPELGGKRYRLMDLLGVKSGPQDSREEQAVGLLRKMIGASVSKTLGTVDVSVTSPWRSVSLSIASALLKGVSDYNQKTRQGQAVAERKFVESRLAVATSDLRAAEDRLGQFLRGNRDVGGSAELAIERDRIQRDVTLRQQVFTTLTQAYEEARVREVRDMPSISVFESPWAPVLPLARGRVRTVVLGFIAGMLFGAFVVFLMDALARRRSAGSTEVDEFTAALSQMKGEVFGGVKKVRNKLGSPPSRRVGS